MSMSNIIYIPKICVPNVFVVRFLLHSTKMITVAVVASTAIMVEVEMVMVMGTATVPCCAGSDSIHSKHKSYYYMYIFFSQLQHKSIGKVIELLRVSLTFAIIRATNLVSMHIQVPISNGILF